MAMLKDAQAAAMPPRPSPTGDHDLNRPRDTREAVRATGLAMQPGASNVHAPDQPATPEEQAEYDRASAALQQALYENSETRVAVASMLRPEERVGSIAKAAMMILTTLDNENDFDEVTLPSLLEETVDRLEEIYEAKTGEDLSDNDSKAALISAFEGLMEVYPVQPDDYAQLTQGMDNTEVDGMEDEYRSALREASNG